MSFAFRFVRPLLASAVLLAAAASPAAPVVYKYTGTGTDGSSVTGTFGWNADAVASYVSPNGRQAGYSDSPTTPVGGFMTGQVSGGLFDGASLTVELKYWEVLDGNADPYSPTYDVVHVIGATSWIWLEDDTATALSQTTAALPDQLDLSAWGSEHRGRLYLGPYQEVDFSFTSIQRVTENEPSSVPEPASLALVGLAGAAGVVARRRRA